MNVLTTVGTVAIRNVFAFSCCLSATRNHTRHPPRFCARARAFVIALTAAVICTAGAPEAWARSTWGYSAVFAIHASASPVDNNTGIPRATGIADVFPNPFNPRVTVAFDVAEPDVIELSIFDVRGHLIRHLESQSRVAGSYEAVWDGLDDSGHVASTGIYFCRLTSASGVQTRKLTMVR
jgi:hypothetical protein